MQVGADSVMPYLDNDCLMRVELQLAALALGARKVLCQWGRAREASGVCAHRAHVRRRIVLKTTTLSVAQFSTRNAVRLERLQRAVDVGGTAD